MTRRPRLYKEIIEGRFDIYEIIRLEKTNNDHTISDKTFEFSSGTIIQLIKEGFEDATKAINIRNQLSKKAEKALVSSRKKREQSCIIDDRIIFSTIIKKYFVCSSTFPLYIGALVSGAINKHIFPLSSGLGKIIIIIRNCGHQNHQKMK